MKQASGKGQRIARQAAHLPVFFFFILSLCVGMIVAGCGGGDGANPSPPPSTTGTASGHLIVPPNNSTEVEPNNTIDEAQVVTANSVISGSAAATDPGFPLPGAQAVEVEDLYRLNAAERVQITLTIASDDLNVSDLDLVLMDNTGNVLDVSQGLISTEMIETPGAGDFLVGVQAVQGSSAYVLAFASLLGGNLASAQSQIIPPGAEFVPGEILVKLRVDNIGTRQQATSLAANYGLMHKRSFPQGVELMEVSLVEQRVPQGKISAKLLLPQAKENALKALTLESIYRLRLDPAVEYAEPNFILRPFAVPNDQFFNLQWHYELINLPQAWDATVGSDNVIVAIIDTGVLVDHPDLSARLFDGFDFVSDPASANDGDGVDPNPNDPGDDPRSQSSSFHGTHVAGTIGAVTNNTLGIAGVTWQTRIMPLRVLGIGGGTTADIVQAIRYAAGLPNSSGTVPANRAHIMNMSLGGPGFSQTLQDAIQAAREQGVIIVAAAGNSNSGVFTSPAALDGVISVSAVDIESQKAPYSNFGPQIDVAAPGGDTGVDLNADGFADGVLSTIGDDEGDFFFRFLNGTSMSSPHMAGVIALMLAVNPNLTPTDIDQLLAGTHPDTTLRITRDLGEPGRDDIYGHGLIDASQAVFAAQSIPGGAGSIPTGSVLSVSTNTLNFENFINALSFAITNAGSGTLTITEITDDAPWLVLTPSSGTTPLIVHAIIDRAGLASGEYTATIQITSDATQGNQTATIQVKMEVGGDTVGNIGTVFVLVLDNETFDTVAQVETDLTQNYAFTIPSLAPGDYFIIAGTDRDNDDFICEIEDACGFFPDPVTITAGQESPDITFVVAELLSPQSTNSTLRRLSGKILKRLH